MFYYLNGGEHLPEDEDPTEYMTEQDSSDRQKGR